MSNIVNKVKDAVTGHPHHTSGDTHSTTGVVGQGNHGTRSTTQGTTHSKHGGTTSSNQPPHSSKVANKLDPRVDSQATTGPVYGTHGTHAGMTSGTQPPHSSTTANKLDPRVTENHYNPGLSTSGGTGRAGHTALPHETGHTSTAEQSSKLGGNGHMGHGALGGAGSALGAGTTHHATGHHSSQPGLMPANPLPSSTMGSGGALGSGTGHHAAGHHGSNAMHSSVGSGTASRTAGPHDSNVANKLDPRVDSDLDGSRTVGGGATHNSRTGNLDNKDPTDAAQVPPSVMSKHVGAPEVTHNDPKHDRTRRHSAKPGDSLREYGSGTT
ncbi:hypothetical protein EMPG_12287 [Blastomyces silverae]|uniref:Cell surface protein n=1 Tax=Blastomyces silverae TaxID=2060906 RepID=A0A0H1BNL6_9EURO|nr:hypothetical protein EMPG_12287 [Blastomyces silverae]